MIQKYVLDAGIGNQQIAEAMLKVPRHQFVDPVLWHQAYAGKSLPIGFGQTISHPATVAIMTAALELAGNERVLEIGTGSGYQAAVLAEMGAKVFTIERIRQLANRARQVLEKLGYYSVAVKSGDGNLGWREHAPYDRLIITASAAEVPDVLLNQLKENGLLVAPMSSANSQKLIVYRRNSDELSIVRQYSRNFVPLISEKGPTV